MRAMVLVAGAAMMATLPDSVVAQTSIPQVDALRACGTIAKKSARLACYDAMTDAGVRAVPQPAPAYAPAADAPMAAAPMSRPVAPPAAAAPAPAVAFGSEVLRTKTRTPRAPQANAVEGRVATASDNGIGHWVIVLEGGARWQMTESSSTFQPPKQGDTVSIRRGALGSYRMTVGRQSSVTVARIG